MESITETMSGHTLPEKQIRSLYAYLQQVTDGRAKRGRRYEAALVLTLMILAKLAGERTVSGIAQWVRLRQVWLGEVLAVTRLPCANTYAYICAHLDPTEVNAQVAAYFAQAAPDEGAAELVHWALDGKVLRGSHRQSPVTASGQEVLGVYAVGQGYQEYCQTIAGKGYEAATAQTFVTQTDCTGKVITADALHTRPRLARRIRRQMGHYIFLVKRNRAQLEAEIRQLFALPPNPQFPVETVRTTDTDHGRLTARQLSTSSELNLALADEWQDVAQVFLLERRVTRHGRTAYESVCGLTSLPATCASPAQLLAWVRAHWHIENRAHWRRDATLGEDACTVRHPIVSTLLAVLNAAVLALLDRLKTTNARSAIRRFAAFPEKALALIIQPPDF